MVLGTLILRTGVTLFFAACLLCGACGRTSEAQAPVALVGDQADVDRVSLQIVTRGNTCSLRAGGAEMALQPKAPCFFLRRGGKVQNFAYSDVKADFVVIIAGTELSDAKRKTWNLKQGEICGEAAQAVLQTAGQVRVSKAVRAGGVYCRDLGVDEKDFFSFAHDPE